MRNKAIEYPHPVLNEYTRDYLNSKFGIDVLSHTDTGSEIVIELECQIDCDGLIQTIASDDAKAIVRLTCYRTSLREMYDLNPSGSTTIRIEKKKVTDSIDLQSMIIATREINKFKLPEFNTEYFGGIEFKIRKGDVLANEPGIKIKLNTMLEKNMAGIVQVRGDLNAKEMSVHYPEITEESPDLTDYIVITLPAMKFRRPEIVNAPERPLLRYECRIRTAPLFQVFADIRHESTPELPVRRAGAAECHEVIQPVIIRQDADVADSQLIQR